MVDEVTPQFRVLLNVPPFLDILQPLIENKRIFFQFFDLKQAFYPTHNGCGLRLPRCWQFRFLVFRWFRPIYLSSIPTTSKCLYINHLPLFYDMTFIFIKLSVILAGNFNHLQGFFRPFKKTEICRKNWLQTLQM